MNLLWRFQKIVVSNNLSQESSGGGHFQIYVFMVNGIFELNLGGNLVEENVVVVIGLLAKNARRPRRKYMMGMEGLLGGLFIWGWATDLFGSGWLDLVLRTASHLL
jgi:hypothetical protein